MNKQINISFFKQPKICSNSSHKVDFKDKNDKYNPFSNVNYIYELYVSLNKDILLNIENLSYIWLVETQLSKSIDKHHASLMNAFFKLNADVSSSFIHIVNNLVKDKAVKLKRHFRKNACMPCVFCIMHMSFADIGIQVILSKYKDFFIVSCMHIIYIEFHEIRQVKLQSSYDIFEMNM